MPKHVNVNELEQILQAVRVHPDGATLEQLIGVPGLAGSRRTLQRRLSDLVAEGRLTITGRGPSRRYLYHGTGTTIAPIPRITKFPDDDYIPISEESIEIKNYVEQPIQSRAPVGYHRKFLNAYVPNKTFYLSNPLLEHLNQINGKHNSKRAAGTYAHELLNRLLIDLSWNSSRLEGNTYSLLETEKLLATGEGVESKGVFETQMILNHKAAIEFLVDSAEQLEFDRYTILSLHALLSNNLLPNPESCGRLRTIPVGISKTVYYPPEIPQIIEECFGQILATAAAIANPFEQAFFAMVHLPYLQPFEDVNKRVSRLALNIPFIKNNLCPLSFIDVPEHTYIDGILGVYECNRTELLRDLFVWAYERSAARYSVVRQTLGEPDPFRLRYREQISLVVNEVIVKKLNKSEATIFIQKWAEQHINENERLHFVAVVETELLGLHEGNIARYRITPAMFQSWQTRWY
jgi:hypothetical protein